MMKIRDLNLYLSPDDYPATEFERFFKRDFAFAARFICNYLRRYLKEKKADGDGFTNVCIEGHSHPKKPRPYMSIFSKSLVIEIPVDIAKYKSISPDRRTEFFLGMLLEGSEKLRMVSPKVADELLVGIELFRRGGCNNRWTFKEKSFKEMGLRAKLDCEMDPHDFKLTLTVSTNNSDVVFSKIILETSPDETCFQHRFKDVIVADGRLVVMDRHGSELYSWRPETLN
jgi:hypothetical protein